MTASSSFPERPSFYDGQILVAMPGMSDARFARSVIYVCAHSADGAMGIVVNHPAATMTFSEILVQLDVMAADEVGRLPDQVAQVPVVKGGPVETGRGFVLHSSDYFVDNSTLTITGGVSLTATLDILRAMSQGRGPRRAILALGYAGWASGQLEAEIQDNGWLHCPADHNLIFDPFCDDKYERAMRTIGIDPLMLSAEAGHA